MINVAILGAHSAVGVELLAQALADNRPRKVFVLDELGDAALEQDIRGELSDRGIACQSDLVWRRLSSSKWMVGSSQGDRDGLFSAPLTVFVAPHRPVPGMTADQIECVATSGLQQLAHLLEGRDAVVNYLSSHLVAGDRLGAFTEYDTDCGQKPRNAHEHAAILGEAQARKLFSSKRINILRLPFVSGSQDDGRLFDRDSEFSAIVKWLERDARVINANPDAIIPVAPVDCVAKAVLALATCPVAHGTYHLSGSGLRVDQLCRQLGIRKSHYRGLATSRMRSMLAQVPRQGGADARPQAAVLEPYAYLYPQVHHDAYRYEQLAARLAIAPMAHARIAGLSVARDELQQARYAAALLAVAQAGTVGVLEPDPTWRRSTVIDDISLPYLDAGHGAPVVLLSGALGPEYWLGTMQHLVSRYRCLVVGSVGWSGTQPNQGGYADHGDQAALLKGLIAQLGIREPCHFVATDVAAPTMQYFASRWPDRIASLQLVNPITTPHEMARSLPVSLVSRIADLKSRSKLINELRKPGSLLRSASAFDILISGGGRSVDVRWERLRENIACDEARVALFCAAIHERLSAQGLPAVAELKCRTRVLLFCLNAVSDLALYAKSAAESPHERDVVLIADAGLDAAESKPALVADLIDEGIQLLDAVVVTAVTPSRAEMHESARLDTRNRERGQAGAVSAEVSAHG